jgi:hypothetical protein
MQRGIGQNLICGLIRVLKAGNKLQVQNTERRISISLDTLHLLEYSPRLRREFSERVYILKFDFLKFMSFCAKTKTEITGEKKICCIYIYILSCKLNYCS